MWTKSCRARQGNGNAMGNILHDSKYSDHIGLYRENGKEDGNYRNYRDHIGIILGCIVYHCNWQG